MVLRIPFPAPASSPVGPLRLSTQPGMGSFQEAVTVERASNYEVVKWNGAYKR